MQELSMNHLTFPTPTWDTLSSVVNGCHKTVCSRVAVEGPPVQFSSRVSRTRATVKF